jgi:hypothetical protein
MTLKEMCWLVAVYGDEDIPLWKRERLFKNSSMPAIAGVIEDGWNFVNQLNPDRLVSGIRHRGTYPLFCRSTSRRVKRRAVKQHSASGGT